MTSEQDGGDAQSYEHPFEQHRDPRTLRLHGQKDAYPYEPVEARQLPVWWRGFGGGVVLGATVVALGQAVGFFLS